MQQCCQMTFVVGALILSAFTLYFSVRNYVDFDLLSASRSSLGFHVRQGTSNVTRTTTLKEVKPLFFLAICTAVGPRNAYYLDEWIAFHLIAGVDQFFLRLDAAVDNATRRVVDRWVARQIITLFELHGNPEDENAVVLRPDVFMNKVAARCYDIVAPSTHWMALIDTDEFMFPQHGCSIAEKIHEACHNRLPTVVLWWTMFGSSHLTDRSEGANLVIEDFLRNGGDCSVVGCKNKDYCSECRHTKQIVNTWCVRTSRHAHNHWIERPGEMPLECLEILGHTRNSMSMYERWAGAGPRSAPESQLYTSKHGKMCG